MLDVEELIKVVGTQFTITQDVNCLKMYIKLGTNLE